MQILFLTGLCLMSLVFAVDLSIADISLMTWSIIICSLLILSYLYSGVTNNDVIVFESEIKIINRVPLFKRELSFSFSEIKEIKFRHDWTETFGKKMKPSILKYFLTNLLPSFFVPADYKWVEISCAKKYRFYCFGIEVDYYENEKPAFEDLFKLLHTKGVNVNWTNSTGIYYSQMKETAISKKD